jgi:hypothetical protein
VKFQKYQESSFKLFPELWAEFLLSNILPVEREDSLCVSITNANIILEPILFLKKEIKELFPFGENAFVTMNICIKSFSFLKVIIE